MRITVELQQKRDTKHIHISAVRTFDPSFFCYSASVLEPRYIKMRPKGDDF